MFQDLMNTEIFGGHTIADFLTLNMLASIAGSAVGAIVIIIVGWVIAAWLGSRVRKIGTAHAHLDNTLFNFLGSIVQYVIIGFTMLIVLNTFGIQTTSIVAAVGAAGLAIGLALQGTLSNVAAGVMLILFRPLKIGDFVDVAGQMGTVKDVTLNFTELASLSNTQVIIPNKEVWGNVIENYSVYPTRRAEWYFGVGYGANLKDAEEPQGQGSVGCQGRRYSVPYAYDLSGCGRIKRGDADMKKAPVSRGPFAFKACLKNP